MRHDQTVICLLQAMLSTLIHNPDHCHHLSAGCVLNVNYPSGCMDMIKGICLTHQGTACMFPRFLEVSEQPGPHLAEIEEHTPNLRVFRNYAGGRQE